MDSIHPFLCAITVWTLQLVKDLFRQQECSERNVVPLLLEEEHPGVAQRLAFTFTITHFPGNVEGLLITGHCAILLLKVRIDSPQVVQRSAFAPMIYFTSNGQGLFKILPRLFFLAQSVTGFPEVIEGPAFPS